MSHITVPANIKSISKGIEPIVALLEDHDADMMLINRIEVSMDEILTNIASYAYGEGSGDIDIDYSLDEETRLLTVVIADKGTPFDPLAKEDPDIALSAKERKIGGLGIFIVKKVMDEATYRREEDKNVLTLWKRI